MTNIHLNPVDLKCNKKDKAKVLIVQPQIKENQLNLGEEYCYRLELNHNDKVFIDQVLKESIKNQVDVVVFPEFSVPFSYHHAIKEFSNQNHNILIISGTDSLKRNRSAPPAFSWERGHLGRNFGGRDARAPRGG